LGGAEGFGCGFVLYVSAGSVNVVVGFA